ncbi:MAG TPA: hypothetical protein VFE47_22010 [Tepidisphaeraceae bacterium]|jgi:hypothetical protein|nr:hypothetical protein [Tepidisphaeraceae bacterium]
MWFLKKAPPPHPESPICLVDFNLSDDKNAISQLIRRTAPTLESDTELSPHFDLTGVEYLGPFAAAMF